MTQDTEASITLPELRKLVDSMPFNQMIGIRVTRMHADGVTIECSVRNELRNSANLLHGGVTATMADAAVGIALTRHFRGQRLATTAELKISYLRPILAGKALARAHLIRIGGNLCVGRVDVFDSQRRLAATALATYLLLRAPE